MLSYKRNQVEEAICGMVRATGVRAGEVRVRLKRLLVADRIAEADVQDQLYAFYVDKPPGSGVEVMFSTYEAFALLAGLILLEHGLPQAAVVQVMRQVRPRFEKEHTRVLKTGPKVLFDQEAIAAQVQPGMIGLNNADPVFLAVARLTGSSVEDTSKPPAAICRGQAELMTFMKARSEVVLGVTYFEFAGAMHEFLAHLANTRPIKRGRGAR